MNDAQILAALVSFDGAILYFQVDENQTRAYESARQRGVIRFDESTDCYVHPNAITVGDFGYTMARAA